jgi:sugar-specific transcriptional regulator TrmB
MSQREVFIILKELGGEATTKQISGVAKNKFPKYSLHAYVYDRLRRLEKKGYVKRSCEEPQKWIIVEEFP